MVPSPELSQPAMAEREIAVLTAAAATGTPSGSFLPTLPHARSRAAEQPDLFTQPVQSNSAHTGCWLRAKPDRASCGETLPVPAFVRM